MLSEEQAPCGDPTRDVDWCRDRLRGSVSRRSNAQGAPLIQPTVTREAVCAPTRSTVKVGHWDSGGCLAGVLSDGAALCECGTGAPVASGCSVSCTTSACCHASAP